MPEVPPSIDLMYDIGSSPFNNWNRAQLWTGVCSTCGRVYRYEIPERVSFADVCGIWMPPTKREVSEWRAERASTVAFFAAHEATHGVCLFHGDHTGACFAGLGDCRFPSSWTPGGESTNPFDRFSRPLLRGLPPAPKGIGSFLPDPSGRYDWRCRAGQVWTQWVASGEHPGSTKFHLNDGVDTGRIVEDVMGWFDDPTGRAPQRFFSGVEWTRWLADGDRVWCQVGRDDEDDDDDDDGVEAETTRHEFQLRVEAMLRSRDSSRDDS